MAIVTVVWVIASMAALALATTGGDTAAAQQGCRGGGGSSASPSQSASPSPSDTGILPTGIPPSLIPGQAPGQADNAPVAAQQDTEPELVEVAPMDPHEKIPVEMAQQDVTCKSTITIAYKSGRRGAFSGKVGSDEPMCKRARKVQVKKVKRGNDPTVGRGVTNPKGAYKVPEPNARGKFYAVVAKSTTENDGGERVACQAARSKTIRA